MTQRLDDGNLESDLAGVWSLLPGSAPSPTPSIKGRTGEPIFASAFDVDRLALTSAGAAAAAGGQASINAGRLAATFATVAEIDGAPLPKWADLSGYYTTADDRLIQLHCNFAHHRDGVVDLLGLASGDRATVEHAIGQRTAADLEAALTERGMIAAMLRSVDEWNAHPHAKATAHLPLLSVTRLGDAPARPERRTRVLDCSRVLAGPVAGQTLAAQGADVLRLGATHLPSVPICVMSTGFGKRNASVDVKTTEGSSQMAELLDNADVWLDAYRPGAFEANGFEPHAVAERSPGCVIVQLSAFDWEGPWAGRRGFDSIVQSTTGIVSAGSEASGRQEPTPLPVQALDYATGFLAAAAAARLVSHQRTAGGSWLVRLSLLRTRNHLVSLGGPRTFEPTAPSIDRDGALHTVTSSFGELTTALPVVGAIKSPPDHLGTSSATWEPDE